MAQAYDEHHTELADHLIPMMEKWCKRHGWNHVVHQVRSTDHDYDHNYRKYPLVKDLMRTHEIVVWADTDVVPVSGEDFEMPYGDVQFSWDRHGLCAGFMAYKSSQWASDFVTGLTSIIPRRGLHRTHEQDCLKALTLIGDCGNHVRMLSETIVANPTSPKSVVPPVFYHAWSNAGVRDAIDRAMAICNFNKAQ